MKCSKCNATDHEEGALFCHVCGTQLRENDVVSVRKDEYNNLCQSDARLKELLQKGYAPQGSFLISDTEYKSLNDSKRSLDTILRQGYAPSGKILISKAEYEALSRRPSKDGGNSTRWLIIASVAFIAVLLFLVIKNTISNEHSSTDEPATEIIVEQTEFPNNLSGNYIVRIMKGNSNSNASVKVYQEGSGYAMNVYSSTITKKYTFTYNPSTGVILSDELGSGKARIKGITNEIEITFAGWELLK